MNNRQQGSEFTFLLFEEYHPKKSKLQILTQWFFEPHEHATWLTSSLWSPKMTTSTTSKIVIAISGIFVLFLIVVSVVSIHREGALFIPGLAPKAYKEGAEVILDVNKVTSIHQAVPFRYHSLPVCTPATQAVESENLGSVIAGNRLEQSSYNVCRRFIVSIHVAAPISEIKILRGSLPEALWSWEYWQDETSLRKWVSSSVVSLISNISSKYSRQLDDLPAAVVLQTNTKTYYTTGFPLGKRVWLMVSFISLMCQGKFFVEQPRHHYDPLQPSQKSFFWQNSWSRI